MASTSHANTFRPIQLDDVLGQARHVKSLRYFLKNNELPPVILISGKTGCGKTTTARIIAAAAMCPKFDPEAMRACGTCVNCRSAQGVNDGPNFMHLDGGGKNLKDIVEDDLRMFLHSSPVKGRYKVCIADEAQALSLGAKNSLLTLAENLPKSALIIMTTTDPEAIDAAILTRSLKYHFAPIPVEDMIEGVIKQRPGLGDTDSREALAILAGFAEGSMREFWQLIQQWESYEEPLTADLAAEIVGGAKARDRATLWQAVEGGDLPGIQRAWKYMINAGANPQRLGGQLMSDVYQMSADKPLERDWTDAIRLLSQAQVYKEELGYVSALMAMAKSPAEQVNSLTVDDLAERLIRHINNPTSVNGPDVSMDIADKIVEGNQQMLARLEQIKDMLMEASLQAVKTHVEADRPKETFGNPKPVQQAPETKIVDPAPEDDEKSPLGQTRVSVEGSFNEALSHECIRRQEVIDVCEAAIARLEAPDRKVDDAIQEAMTQIPDVDELELSGDTSVYGDEHLPWNQPKAETVPPWEPLNIKLSDTKTVYNLVFRDKWP